MSEKMVSCFSNEEAKEKYKQITGKDYDLLITNVIISTQNELEAYQEILKQFPEIELVDEAYDICGNKLLGRVKAFYFKERYDLERLQEFYKLFDKV